MDRTEVNNVSSWKSEFQHLPQNWPTHEIIFQVAVKQDTQLVFLTFLHNIAIKVFTIV